MHLERGCTLARHLKAMDVFGGWYGLLWQRDEQLLEERIDEQLLQAEERPPHLRHYSAGVDCVAAAVVETSGRLQKCWRRSDP